LSLVCREMIAAGAARKDEFDRFLRRLEGRPGDPKLALHGNRHFWNSDFMAHHRAGYYTSARMVSKRIVNTDNPCNQEGLVSHHVADGANLLMRTGEEYREVFPVWDWQRVPGVTVEYTGGRPRGSVRTTGGAAFVGGVSDGTYGAAAMDLARGALRARKAWFFFDDEYVCLGAGITCTSDLPVRTSVNQCRLEDVVRMGGEPVEKGTHRLTAPAAVHHAGVAYVFPEPAAVTLRNARQTGSWHRLRRASPRTQVAVDVFSLWLGHGPKPEGGRSRYAYVVAPGLRANQVNAYARSLPVKIIANTPALQAVRHGKLGLTLAAFYRPGALAISQGLTVEPDKPCLVLVRERDGGLRVAVAQPHGRDKGVTVTISRALDGKGCKTLEGRTTVRFELPREGHAGQSVIRSLSSRGE